MEEKEDEVVVVVHRVLEGVGTLEGVLVQDLAMGAALEVEGLSEAAAPIEVA